MAEDTIKCINFFLCEQLLPEWWYECKGHWLCTNCDMMFGKWIGGKGVLQQKQDVECPICLETKQGLELPFCQHYLCLMCFKRCYYGKPPPPHPYPDRDESDDPEDPLILAYEINYAIWEDQRADEEHLRKCPICRK